jgi:hypothetical protein
MTCTHQSQPPGKDTGRRLCSIGWYGGKPWVGNCIECISRAENTPEAKAAFDTAQIRAHPPDKKRVSGCCDDARNPAF